MNTTPRQVSKFAREFEQLFIESGQLRTAYALLISERDKLRDENEQLRLKIKELTT